MSENVKSPVQDADADAELGLCPFWGKPHLLRWLYDKASSAMTPSEKYEVACYANDASQDHLTRLISMVEDLSGVDTFELTPHLESISNQLREVLSLQEIAASNKVYKFNVANMTGAGHG